VIWIGGFTRRDPTDLHVKRMPLAKVGGVRFAP